MFETPTHDETVVAGAEYVDAQRRAEKSRIRDAAEGLMSRRERRRAFRAPGVEESKRLRVLLPSAREVFAVRPRQLQPDGTRRTVAWPLAAERDGSYMHRRLLEAGLR